MTAGENPSMQDRLDRLIAFLPVFETPGFSFAIWHTATQSTAGALTLPYCMLTGPASEFVSTAYAAGWVLQDFDWPAWSHTPDAVQLRDDPSALERATAVQLAKLLTVLIRQDRFVEGALASAYDSGLLTAILRRAAILRQEIEREDA